MKVLIVGAAGHVASILRPVLEAEHECHYFDRRPMPETDGRIIVGDVNDEDAIQQGVEGMEAIVYLAMGIRSGTRRDPTDLDPAFSVNLRGAYRFLDQGLRAGARRFVYASTLSVYKPQTLYGSTTIDENVAADGWGPYSISKRVGEFLCQAAAQEYPDATIIALRLVFPQSDAQWEKLDTQSADVRIKKTGPSDLRRLFLLALACDRPGAHIMQATSDMDGIHFSSAHATEVLGWRPQAE